MSLSSLLNIGVKSMTASYAALQVTGNNIANASTAGYSRQSLQVQTATPQQTGNGFFGKGVDITTVSRAHSAFLTRETQLTASLSAADSARSTQLSRIEAAFQTGEAGLGYAAQQLFAAFGDVANAPGDLAARQAALARVSDLAAKFGNADAQLDSVQSGITSELKASVASINSLTAQIASLNQRIASANGSGHAPNDLLDARDKALADLSAQVQVSTVPAADGSVGVFLSGGQKLVLGGDATKLTLVADAYDPQKQQLAVVDGSSTRALPDGYVTGGAVAGLLRVQNHDLPEARAMLGQLATAITSALNAQQALGLDLGTPAAAGAALLAVGAPSVSPATGNAVANAGVSISIADTSALQASDYELVADPSLPAGQYQLTRLSDGQTQTVSSGDVVDGLRIDVTAPLPGARDRFLLQPVSNAAGTMSAVMANPRGIAAAAPVTATTAAANTGTATVRSLAAVDPSINPNLTATITFTDDLGNYTWTLVDTTSALPTTSGSGTWTSGQPIALNGFELKLDGQPKGGDVVGVARTADPASSNGNANALLALADAKLVSGQTITDAWANDLATIGVRVQTASAAADASARLATDAQAANGATAGVNLDEEAARLIQYQQAYQAAAKILQIAQSLFDSLLK